MFLSNDVRSCFHQHIHHLIRVDKGGISRVTVTSPFPPIAWQVHFTMRVMVSMIFCLTIRSVVLRVPVISTSPATMLPAVPPHMVPSVSTPLSSGGNTAAHQNLQAVYDSSSHDNGIHPCIRISPMTAFSTKFYVYMVRRGI